MLPCSRAFYAFTQAGSIRNLRDARIVSLGACKASRSCSSPPAHPRSSPLPLMQQNLQALEDSQMSASEADSAVSTANEGPYPAMRGPASPTRANNNLDTSLKLAAYRIFVEYGRELPKP
jgi:hypothetical protein